MEYTDGNGAEALVHTLLDAGVTTCFANPGTSEMHFVAALDRIDGMNCVLGLFEGVVTGAADGYYRMTRRPAATLLHLGPGLANGLANLHNAKKARSGIVNVVGDHAGPHLTLDAPLTSDIDGLARPMSHWVRRVDEASQLSSAGREAVERASRAPAEVATLILQADAAWSPTPTPMPSALRGPVQIPRLNPVDPELVQDAANALESDPGSTLVLLGGLALSEASIRWAHSVAATTGCALMSEFYVARMERGGGLPHVPRLPYAVDAALAALAPYRTIILVDAAAPVAFFAYPGKPGKLWHKDARFIELAGASADNEAALHALAERVGARSKRVAGGFAPSPPGVPGDGAITPEAIAAVLTAHLPEGAIVVDESISTGRGFGPLTSSAASHSWLTGMGGSIGFGLPVGVGAAIGAPDRPVVVLEGDGSGMYTQQALWTAARHGLNLVVLIFANRRYQILQGEFKGVGAGQPGARASDMLSIDRPALDWVLMSRGMGVDAARVDTVQALVKQFQRALREPGPALIEIVL